MGEGEELVVKKDRDKHDRMLNVRISAADARRLENVARANGLSQSATVRLLVKQAADRMARKRKAEAV